MTTPTLPTTATTPRSVAGLAVDTGSLETFPLQYFLTEYDGLRCWYITGIRTNKFHETQHHAVYNELAERLHVSPSKPQPGTSRCSFSGSPNVSLARLWIGDQQPTPPESNCPSLSSSLSSNGDIFSAQAIPNGRREPRTRVLQAESRSAPCSTQALATATSLLDIQTVKPEPPIYVSVRKILSKDPEYARYVISTIEKLPTYRRNVLVGFKPDTLTAWTSQQEAAPEDGETKGSRAPSEWQGAESTGSSASNDKSASSSRDRKRQAPGKGGADGGEGGNGNGPGEGDGKSDELPAKKKPRPGRRWQCPFYVAFPHIVEFSQFGACRPPGYMYARSDWKNHLKRAHSPDSKLKDKDSGIYKLYYMDDVQWKAVQKIIDQAGSHRPRGADQSHNNACFIDVWRIIFPKEVWPDLREPQSAFGSHQPERSSHQDPGSVLFDVMYTARAELAVKKDLIKSKDMFRMSHQDYRDMMSEVFEIVAHLLPEISERVMESSPGALRAAAADVVDPMRRRLSSTVTPGLNNLRPGAQAVSDFDVTGDYSEHRGSLSTMSAMSVGTSAQEIGFNVAVDETGTVGPWQQPAANGQGPFMPGVLGVSELEPGTSQGINSTQNLFRDIDFSPIDFDNDFSTGQ